jgi:hypothetical protein
MCEIFCVRGPCATGEQTFGVALYMQKDRGNSKDYKLLSIHIHLENYTLKRLC